MNCYFFRNCCVQFLRVSSSNQPFEKCGACYTIVTATILFQLSCKLSRLLSMSIQDDTSIYGYITKTSQMACLGALLLVLFDALAYRNFTTRQEQYSPPPLLTKLSGFAHAFFSFSTRKVIHHLAEVKGIT